MIDYDVFAKFTIKNVSVRDKKLFLINTPLTGKVLTWNVSIQLEISRDK
jgi:hypothetical protein